jgi:CDP-glycerol glycerophosphotransferase (TagB/SpsB family)
VGSSTCLYCTHGPITTERFDRLAERHRSFRVIETGWPKLDPYLGQREDGASTPPTVVYAPTFSPSLSSASSLLPELTRLARAGRFRFLVKFHPKMERSVVQDYRGAVGEGLEIAETQDLLAILRGGSVVLSDTSSAVTEALLLGKTVVTFRNAEPQPCLIDFSDPRELPDRLEQALTPDEALRAAISDYIAEVHPWTDGNSSARVLDAALKALALGVRRKPLNLVRKLKIRRQLGYFGLQLSGAASPPATQH